MQSKVDNESLRILVVDDSDIGRTLLKKMLTKFRYSVDSAENGIVALEMIKRDVFDVVLTDINMPELDGIGIVNKH
jgi:CheY-like chemotaxis protein